MKVLWVTNLELPDIAQRFGRKYNTGGWLNTVSQQLGRIGTVDLYVASPCSGNTYKGIGIKDITYYSFKEKSKENLKEIIMEVEPDIVHVWGTEFEHSYNIIFILQSLEMIEKTVVSIQGIVSVIGKYHYITSLQQNVIKSRTLAEFFFRNVYLNIEDQQKHMILQGKKEIEILKKIKYCIGRTDFDKAYVKQINLNIQYFHCNETLRENFYNKKWKCSNCKKHTIFFGQSYYPVKGFHVFVEALAIIREKYPDVEVKVIGKNVFKNECLKDVLVKRSYPSYIKKLILKYGLMKNIKWLGQQDEGQMVEQYLNANVFVSASVIENSSNSIGEAMLLGVPIVASDVG